MGGFLGEDQIRRIKEAVDLVDVMADYTTLQRAGSQFKALCPFHQERTPSCVIYPDDQQYHCFSCGEHGDVISLISQKENLSFVDTMELLARRAGIELVYEQRARGNEQLRRSQRQALLELMDRAVSFYERYLWERDEGAEARAYLAQRGLGEEVCRAFRLGFAPSGDRLVAVAKRQGYQAHQLLEADLAVERYGRLADRFRERLLFPICDRFGQPLAFSGRLLPAAERAAKEAGRGVGKYVNSTDTPLYHKGSVVFNLHRARTSCRQAGAVIVMEGPTDVMAAAQAGCHHCVAVLGTAMTPRHAQHLRSIAGGGRIILLFDGDRAGRDNSLKAVSTMLAEGIASHAAMLPEGADPAELLAAGTSEALTRFESIIAGARPDMQHLLTSLAPRPLELDARQGLAVADRLLAIIQPISDLDLRQGLVQEIADYLGHDPLRLANRLKQRPPRRTRRGDDNNPEATPQLPIDLQIDTVLRLLALHPQLRAPAFDDWGCEPSLFPHPWHEVATWMLVNPNADIKTLAISELAMSHPGMRQTIQGWLVDHAVAARLAEQHSDDDPAKALRTAIDALLERESIRQARHDRQLLRQHAGDDPEAAALFKQALEKRKARNANLDDE